MGSKNQRDLTRLCVSAILRVTLVHIFMRRAVSTLFWLETALALIGLSLLAVRRHLERVQWHELILPTWRDTALGIAVTAVMLLVAAGASVLAERSPAWAFLKRWMMQVSPLVSAMRPRDALAVSLVAGFGEEMLFRGVLQPILTIWVASALFAVVHVLRWDRDGLKMTAFYLPFGLLLGYLYAFTGNLWGCCVAHVLYDVIALWWMRRQQGAQK